MSAELWPPVPIVLLQGVVGSTAYGLATPSSDVDTLGIMTYPTSSWWGLRTPPESKVTEKPDITLHEAAKYCRLALKCNPTLLELLWLPEDLLQVCSMWGDELRDIRGCFLSAKSVRNSYLGYASSQFERLRNRGDGSFSADTRKRTAKHARHMLRLLIQGHALHSTGNLPIRLAPIPAAEVARFGELVASGHIDYAAEVLRDYEELFNEPGVLPAAPDQERVEQWLWSLRCYYAPSVTAS